MHGISNAIGYLKMRHTHIEAKWQMVSDIDLLSANQLFCA